jgi:gluconokinase
MQRYVIGIDIGTGSTKAVAVARSGAVLAEAQVHYPTSASEPSFSEQDPETIWNAFVKTIREIRNQLQEEPLAVSLSSCMHSLILIDADHNPLTPNITWADRRSAAIAEAVRSTPEGEAIYKSTGTPLHAMSPLCKIRWFKEKEQGLFKKTARFISIKEYIWFKLFGVYEIDYSVASATGLFDVQRSHWFAPALQFCAISSTQLSTPVSTHFIRTGLPPSIALLLNLPDATPFCIGASDGCLANVGSDALRPGTAAVTIGTSGAVRMASPNPIAVFPDMLFNYRLDSETFICGGAVNNGGNVVQWLLQQFLESTTATADDYARLFHLAAQVPAGCEGLLCLPYLNGERTPLWDERTCGAFFGFRPQHGKAHFVRAALEGVCFGLYGVLKKLEAAAAPVHTLQVSGGVVHSEMWMQLLADVTGKTLCLLPTGDASAAGAALLCFKALGETTQYLNAENKAPRIITPNAANHAVYEERFPVFTNLYQTLKTTMHQLHQYNGS